MALALFSALYPMLIYLKAAIPRDAHAALTHNSDLRVIMFLPPIAFLVTPG